MNVDLNFAQPDQANLAASISPEWLMELEEAEMEMVAGGLSQAEAQMIVAQGVAQAKATLALAIRGIGAMMGKIQWTTVLIAVSGMPSMFGGGEIVSQISGGKKAP